MAASDDEDFELLQLRSAALASMKKDEKVPEATPVVSLMSGIPIASVQPVQQPQPLPLVNPLVQQPSIPVISHLHQQPPVPVLTYQYLPNQMGIHTVPPPSIHQAWTQPFIQQPLQQATSQIGYQHQFRSGVTQHGRMDWRKPQLHANVRTTSTAALSKHGTNLRELTRITEPSSGHTRPFRGDVRFPNNNNNRNDTAKPQSSTLLDLPQYKWSEPPTSAGPSEPKKKVRNRFNRFDSSSGSSSDDSDSSSSSDEEGAKAAVGSPSAASNSGESIDLNDDDTNVDILTEETEESQDPDLGLDTGKQQEANVQTTTQNAAANTTSVVESKARKDVDASSTAASRAPEPRSAAADIEFVAQRIGVIGSNSASTWRPSHAAVDEIRKVADPTLTRNAISATDLRRFDNSVTKPSQPLTPTTRDTTRQVDVVPQIQQQQPAVAVQRVQAEQPNIGVARRASSHDSDTLTDDSEPELRSERPAAIHKSASSANVDRSRQPTNDSRLHDRPLGRMAERLGERVGSRSPVRRQREEKDRTASPHRQNEFLGRGERSDSLSPRQRLLPERQPPIRRRSPSPVKMGQLLSPRRYPEERHGGAMSPRRYNNRAASPRRQRQSPSPDRYARSRQRTPSPRSRPHSPPGKYAEDRPGGGMQSPKRLQNDDRSHYREPTSRAAYDDKYAENSRSRYSLQRDSPADQQSLSAPDSPRRDDDVRQRVGTVPQKHVVDLREKVLTRRREGDAFASSSAVPTKSSPEEPKETADGRDTPNPEAEKLALRSNRFKQNIDVTARIDISTRVATGVTRTADDVEQRKKLEPAVATSNVSKSEDASKAIMEERWRQQKDNEMLNIRKVSESADNETEQGEGHEQQSGAKKKKHKKEKKEKKDKKKKKKKKHGSEAGDDGEEIKRDADDADWTEQNNDDLSDLDPDIKRSRVELSASDVHASRRTLKVPAADDINNEYGQTVFSITFSGKSEREVSEHLPSSIQSRLGASGRVRVQESASNAASGREIPPLMSAAKHQSLERYHPTKRKQQLQVGRLDIVTDEPPLVPKSAKARGSDLRELLKRRQLHETAGEGNANNDDNDRSRGGQKRRHSRMKNV